MVSWLILVAPGWLVLVWFGWLVGWFALKGSFELFDFKREKGKPVSQHTFQAKTTTITASTSQALQPLSLSKDLHLQEGSQSPGWLPPPQLRPVIPRVMRVAPMTAGTSSSSRPGVPLGEWVGPRENWGILEVWSYIKPFRTPLGWFWM